MNAVFVYRGRYLVRQALELETLASVLRNAGHCAALVHDPDTFGVTDNVFRIPALAGALGSPGRLARRIRKASPDVALFSSLPGTHAFLIQTAAILKKHSAIPVLFLGLHPTLVPATVMTSPCVDFVLAGEAETALPSFLNTLAGSGDWSRVPNLWYRKNRALLHTPMAPLVDLDGLPLPDKSLFSPLVSHARSYPATVSRGCPFACGYCEETCQKLLYGPKYFRRKNVDKIVQELVTAKKRYGFSEVIFKDSYLNGDVAWLRALMERYKNEVGLAFKCFATISGFSRETAILLKQGGCYCVEFGLQIWNRDIRKNTLHRPESDAQALAAFRACDAQNLRYDIDHMFGLPGETSKDHALAVSRYAGMPCLNRVKVHYLVYLPTAPIVEKGLEAKCLPPNAAELLSQGLATDFYDQSFTTREQSQANAGYAALLKLLPGLPNRAVSILKQPRHARKLGRIPAPLMAFFQALIALRNHDRRFAIYLADYPRQVIWGVLRALMG